MTGEFYLFFNICITEKFYIGLIESKDYPNMDKPKRLVFKSKSNCNINF